MYQANPILTKVRLFPFSWSNRILHNAMVLGKGLGAFVLGNKGSRLPNRGLLSYPRVPHCETPFGAWHKHHPASLPTTVPSSIIGFAKSYGPSSTLLPAQPRLESCHQSNVLRCWICCQQNTKRPIRHCAFLFVVGYEKFNIFSLTLEGISQYVPDHGTPKKFTELAGPDCS